MKTIRIYAVSKEKKEEIKNIINRYSQHDDVTAKGDYSKKRNLKGISCYKKGSKSLFMYIDLLKKEVVYYNRRKVLSTQPLV